MAHFFSLDFLSLEDGVPTLLLFADLNRYGTENVANDQGPVILKIAEEVGDSEIRR